jgi:UDP-N-acetylmuramate dehydrogenase
MISHVVSRQAKMSLEILENIPLAPRTTLNLGGPARFFCACTSLEEIRAGLAWAAEEDLPVQVLGGGSNVIFPDAGYAGLVLQVDLQGVDFQDQGSTVRLRAAAGQEWDPLVLACIERGLGGLECLSGIPGRVGATPIQNVGAYGQEVSDTLLCVEALDRRTLERVEFSAQECGFSYRRSRFKAQDGDCYVITFVTYGLQKHGRPQPRYPELQRHLEEHFDLERLESGRPALEAVRQAVLHLRRRKSMVLDPADPNTCSAGSFFLNPVLGQEEFACLREQCPEPERIPHFPAPGGIKVPAAWLVEKAGFPKGYRRGGVGISPAHALALVNFGGTTRELLELAEEIRQGVAEKFGIWLEREPVLVE